MDKKSLWGRIQETEKEVSWIASYFIPARELSLSEGRS